VKDKKGIALLAIAVIVGSLLWVVARPSGNSAQALIEGLNGTDAVECFSQLRQLEDDKTDTAIIEGTRHASARVRGQCARLLGQRQDVTMVSVLTPMLSDPDQAVRNQAARSLLPLLDDEEMVELLRTSKLPNSSQIVMLGAALRDPVAITNKNLLDWTLDRSHSSELRQGCYGVLRTHHSPCFGDKKSEKEQLPAVLAARARIQQQSREDAVDRACPLEVRCSALPLYATLQGPSAYDETLGFLKSPEPLLREAALMALAYTEDGRAWPLFCRLAVDSHQPERFRIATLSGLRHLAKKLGHEKAAFPLFCKVIEDINNPAPVRAAALGHLRPYRFEPEAMRIARQALTEKQPLMRVKAANSLAGLGDWNAPLDSPLWLQPSLDLVKAARTSESDPDAKCAMDSAIRSLESRIANRGK
jgi:HEAT repeat protein